MAGIDAPQPRRAVEHFPPIGGGVMHILGAHEHSRTLFELPVRGERHPKGTKVVRNGRTLRHRCSLSGIMRRAGC